MFISRLLSDEDGKITCEDVEFVTWEKFDELLGELAAQTGTRDLGETTRQPLLDVASVDCLG
jgi:hypothetical protein